MVVDALGPAVQVYEPVDGGELAAEHLLPLGVHHRVYAADVVDRHDAV